MTLAGWKRSTKKITAILMIIIVATASYFFISFYVISSWSEWWYGASFSGRSMITPADHFWVKASLDIRFPENFEGAPPFILLTMERRGGPYRYHAPEINIDPGNSQWQKIELVCLTPEIRNTKDRFKCNVWNRGKAVFDIDNVKLEIYR